MAAYLEGLRSEYERHLDKSRIQQRTNPHQLDRQSQEGRLGSEDANKKQVRFQVYEAKNLTSIQDMRRAKMQDLDRFSRERLLQQTISEQY